MTETVGTTSEESGTAAPRRGLTIERVHTTAGVHPYDDVVWEVVKQQSAEFAKAPK